MTPSILWRGPLDSCNYGCAYCPFAKSVASRAELRADRAALDRFLGWVEQSSSVSVFFTPWGEALVRRYYQDAIVRLSHLPQVGRVAIQTNLSGSLAFLDRCDTNKVGIWATYHPDWTTRERFVRQVWRAHEAGARISAGVVGFPEHLDAIEALRAEVPEGVYLWVNSVKRLADVYGLAELERFEAVDPLFRANLRPHRSRGRACDTGNTVIAVDGEGDIRRCHFVDGVIGNIYRDDLGTVLRPRPCPNDVCRCHIGYVHMPELGLQGVFGEGVLERAPEGRPVLPATAVSDAADPLAPAQAPLPGGEARRARVQWSRV